MVWIENIAAMILLIFRLTHHDRFRCLQLLIAAFEASLIGNIFERTTSYSGAGSASLWICSIWIDVVEEISSRHVLCMRPSQRAKC